MLVNRGLRCAVPLGALFALCASSRADINLELRVSSTVIELDNTLEVGLYAVSDDQTDQTFTALEVILDWDPSVLRFDGKIDNGFAWNPPPSFPCDGCLGKLNFEFDCPQCCGQPVCDPSYTGLPANDGDALFQALQFASDDQPFPQATPEGMLVTTIVVTAIRVAASTELAILASSCVFAQTRVIHHTVESGTLFLTGSLGSLSLSVAVCGARGDFDGNCRVELNPDHLDFIGCMDGPDGAPLPLDCAPADFDGDGFADMLDAAAFQREFTGP